MLYRWTNTVYGCDAVYHGGDEPKTNYSYPVLVVTNLVVMLVSYSLVFWQTWHYTGQPGHRQNSHTTMLVILSLTYTVCVVPAMLTSWDLWSNEYRGRVTVENICTSIYWCMYGERPGTGNINSVGSLVGLVTDPFQCFGDLSVLT